MLRLIPGLTQPGRKSSGKPRRTPLAAAKQGRRLSGFRGQSLTFESLEDRAMLTVADNLVSQLTPYQDALDTALDVMTSLPLVGDQLSELQKWNTVFHDSVE